MTIFSWLTSTHLSTTSASLGMHTSAWCSWFITFDCNSFIVIERSLVRFWERRKPFFLQFLRPQKIITVFRRHAEKFNNAEHGAECFDQLIKSHYPNTVANFFKFKCNPISTLRIISVTSINVVHSRLTFTPQRMHCAFDIEGDV